MPHVPEHARACAMCGPHLEVREVDGVATAFAEHSTLAVPKAAVVSRMARLDTEIARVDAQIARLQAERQILADGRAAAQAVHDQLP